MEETTKKISMTRATEEYGLSRPTFYRAANEGRISLYKLGGKTFLDRQEIEKLFVKVK